MSGIEGSLGAITKCGFLSTDKARPSNRMYQVSFWKYEAPVTAQTSDWSTDPGQSIKSRIFKGILVSSVVILLNFPKQII